MVQFRISEFKEFIDFLGLTDSEYIDVTVRHDTVHLVNNSSQIFGELLLQSRATPEDIGKSFRIPRMPMTKLAVPGITQIDFKEDTVEISVLGNSETPLWEFSFKKQEVYNGEYRAKMELCKALHEYDAEDVACLYEVAKLAKPFRTMISVQNGFAVGFVNTRVRLLKRVKLKYDFSVNADAFLTLYTFSRTMRKAKNFLAVQTGTLTVLATLCLPAESMDFNYTEQQKSAMKCDLELRNVIELMNKIDFKEEYLMFDFKSGSITLEKNRVQYKVPLLIFNLQCSPTYDLKPIAIPVSIFKLLITRMGDSFKLSKRPTYTRLECRDLVVYL